MPGITPAAVSILAIHLRGGHERPRQQAD